MVKVLPYIFFLNCKMLHTTKVEWVVKHIYMDFYEVTVFFFFFYHFYTELIININDMLLITTLRQETHLSVICCLNLRNRRLIGAVSGHLLWILCCFPAVDGEPELKTLPPPSILESCNKPQWYHHSWPHIQ